MDNPWSSPWTADDPQKDVRAEEGAFAFPAGKFEVADPAGVWGYDGFGEWAGDGEEQGDVEQGTKEEEEEEEEEEDDDDGLLGPEGLDVVGVHRLPSPSAEVDPWAEAVSPVDEDAPAKIDSIPADPLQRDALEGSGLDESDSTALASHIPPEPPLSPDPVWNPPLEDELVPSTPISPVRAPDPADEDDITRSPPAPPDTSDQARLEAPGLGQGADAVAPAVLSHEDAPDTTDATPGPEGARQASKVQELVDMYDGIAKSAETAPEPEPSRRGSTKPDDTDEGEEDWEEFELGDQPPEDAPAVQATPLEPAPKPANTPFIIDEATISTLFDNLDDPELTPADLPEDPDPLSTFTVPERKAWYRLSRQGSPLLHDSGDPDNYTRATWPGSAISRETYAIVRRWMQEGSVLSGRTRAGGVRGSAATFGWARSSSSDPVDLSFLSRRRREEGRVRSESESAAASAQPLGAAPTSVQGMDGVRGGGRPFSMPPPPRPPGAPSAPEVPPSKTAPKRPSPLVLSTTQEPREEDSDEEWGEMVSSPAVAAAPAAPVSRADSVISFGKSGSGSSMDSRATKAEVKHGVLKPEILSPGILSPGISKSLGLGWGREGSGHARVQSLPSFGVGKVRLDTHPTSPLATSMAQNMPISMGPGEEEVVEGIIARLPDLSYMLR